MKTLVLLAGVAAAGLAEPQLAGAQSGSTDQLIDGGSPVQVEQEPNTIGPLPGSGQSVQVEREPNALGPLISTPGIEARPPARRAARARIAVRPRVRAAHTRHGG